ncbi:RagB/SusD family nutrient uptake outer membrane protein [Flavobacterium sp. WLB]|uniref:RagB/SusD family nutrient uptake outer membrane protein n=1 Tax=unclassified Flavobacterium TaxID=196869 RepID=UPI0006ABCACF|nr:MULTISPECIES: RagB/SusD family nutrient uptake outer membrane protein [unclassified Flavobacterium]KOP38975.1 RagB/SusD family protein [Flavobacterium sp. VMW]OWU89814.1 RagB/SusD family protein [Flavobacterium sp. NLM]PUU68020.1 RagB/SusD family nutrient uptake outer membrane protein [Flavobacterium sp. WLB]
MKNLKIALSLLILISVTSCDDFLSEKPDNRTEIDTPAKISEILVQAYPQMSYFDIAETMSDNVFDSGMPETLRKNEQSYNWDIQTETTDIDTQAYYWDACYTAIAHANKALEAIEDLGSPASLNPQKGEALIARAYSHFMLVSLWSKRYNPATAASDLGIPYVTKPETELVTKYKRNTVKEVFDFIEKDIEDGLKIVTNDYKQPKFHFNVSASKAFASRFYLIKGDWDRVLELTSDLGSKPVGKLRDFASYDLLSAVDQRLAYASSDAETNLLIVSANSIVSRSYYSNRFYLSGARYPDIFGTATSLFNKPWLYNFYSSNSSITVFLPKFYEYFKYSNVTAGIGDPYVAEVLLSNDEFFLNRIEAHVMKGDIATANDELEYFLSTRTVGYVPTDKLTEAKVVAKYPVIADEYTPFYTMTPVQTSYVKAIAETRRRDFIHEGMRWFDVKRFNIVVNHETTNKPVNTLVKDDNRRAIQIPLHASNTGVELNPR